MTSLPIAIVMPSYNRAHTLRTTLPLYLDLPIAQLILVDDGSTDDTPQLLATFDDHRLTYIRNDRRLYQPAARNIGIRAATQPYILMGEDDVIMDEAYVRTLFHHLQQLDTQVVAGRLIAMGRGEDTAAALQRSNREAPSKLIHADSLSGDFSCTFPAPVQTPMLHACSLFPRDLALQHPYHEHYRGNALREETDFYMQLHQAGAQLHFCSDAVAYHMYHDYGGGCRSNLLRYILSCLVNNHHFLDRHYHTLSRALDIHDSRFRYEFRLAFGVLRTNLAHWLSIRLPWLHRHLRNLRRRHA